MGKLHIDSAAIVGATGPAGRHLAKELRARGISVRVVSRSIERLADAFPGDDVERSSADALDSEALRRAIAGCELVVDCIGTTAERMDDHRATARNLADAVRASGAYCLHVSSFWAYMPIQYLPLDEDHPRSGGNAFIQARRDAEDRLQDAGAAVIHLPDFYGPLVATSTVQQALANAAAGKSINWIGGPEVARDCIYLPDGMRLAAELALRREAYAERWIFRGDGPISAPDIVATVEAHLGRRVRLRCASPAMLKIVALFVPSLREFMPMVPHYAKPIRFNADKLTALLGPLELTPHRDAIPATLDWLRDSSVDTVAHGR